MIWLPSGLWVFRSLSCARLFQNTSCLSVQPIDSPKGEHYYCSVFINLFYFYMYMECRQCRGQRITSQIVSPVCKYLNLLNHLSSLLLLFLCYRWGLSKQRIVRCLLKVTQSVAQTDPLCSMLHSFPSLHCCRQEH